MAVLPRYRFCHYRTALMFTSMMDVELEGKATPDLTEALWDKVRRLQYVLFESCLKIENL